MVWFYRSDETQPFELDFGISPRFSGVITIVPYTREMKLKRINGDIGIVGL